MPRATLPVARAIPDKQATVKPGTVVLSGNVTPAPGADTYNGGGTYFAETPAGSVTPALWKCNTPHTGASWLTRSVAVDPEGVRGNCLRIDLASGVTGTDYVYIDAAAGEYFDLSGDARVDIYFPTRSGNGESTECRVDVQLSFNDTAYTNWAQFTYSEYVKGWASVGGRSASLTAAAVMDRGPWTVTGTANFAQVKRIRIAFYHPTNQAGDYFLISNVRRGYRNRLKVAWTKDDMSASDWSYAYPALYTAYGWPCTIACITDKLASEALYGYTLAQANTMYAAGWDYCNHLASTDHTGMPSLSVAARTASVAAAEAALAAKGWTRALKIMIYPGGATNIACCNELEAAGFKAAFSYSEGKGNASGPYSLITKFGAGRRAFNGTADTSATILATVDKYIGMGGTLVLGFHTVQAGADTTTGTETVTNLDTLTAVAAGIRQRELQGLLDVVSLVDIVNDRCV